MSPRYQSEGQDVLGIVPDYEPPTPHSPDRDPTDRFYMHEDIDHYALIYDSADQRRNALVAYFRHGLERGDRCFFVVEDEEEAAAWATFEAAGIDVQSAVDTGQLTFATVGETYLKDGTFDPDGMVDYYREVVREASEEYESVRVAADTSWLRHDETSIADFMEYESKVNRLFESVDSVALCTYDRRQFAPEVIRDIICTHPHLVFDDTVCHNLYYTPPSEFFEPLQLDREVDRMVKTLVDRTHARVALQEREHFLSELATIVCDPDTDFPKKLDALFELGCERFDLEFGGLAKVEPARDSLELEYVSDDHEYFKPGLQLPLSETYCATAVENRAAASVTDPEAEGYDDILVYREQEIRTYLGTYISVDGDQDRTFFFLSRERNIGSYTDGAYSFLDLMSQWVKFDLEREIREQRLTALNELSHDLMHASTHEEVADVVVDSADALNLPVAAVALYDEQFGRLAPVASTPIGESMLSRYPLFDVADGLAWDAFVQRKQHRCAVELDDLAGELLILPLSDVGVLIGGRTSDDLSQADVEFFETVGADVRSALDRVEREVELRERERILEEQNVTLERLNRLNDIIRAIDRVLVESSDRAAIEEVVCEQLTSSGPFELAWLGRTDPVDGGVSPSIWAGSGKGYVEGLEADHDHYGPAHEAARERRPVVVNSVLKDPAYARWRQDALKRGYHALIALPLVYDDTLYGVLNIYASQPGVFDSLETAVLAELADNIAYAINAVESKRALVSEEVTELEFRVVDDRLPALALASAIDGEVRLENIVPRSEGGYRMFLSIGAPDRPSIDEIETHLQLDALEIVSSRSVEGGHELLVAGEAEDQCFAITAVDHGGIPRRIHASPSDATIQIELALDADVREFSAMFERKLPESDLIAQRSHERPTRTISQVYADVMSELTPRQLEVLQTAYFSGYFEQPRTRNSVEVAETIGITQPTFNAHLRSAQRTLCQLLFDEHPLDQTG